jgi:DNA-binding XRE family transcriptional regulator
MGEHSLFRETGCMSVSADIAEGGSNTPSPRANFYVARCRTLRIAAGKTKADLMRAARVDRNTIHKIEHLIGVTVEIAHRVFNVLKNWHPSMKLDPEVEITNTNRKIMLTGSNNR